MEKQINEIIDNLASKLGVAASEVYGILIYQSSVEVVKSIFGCVLCIVGLFLWIFVVKKLFINRDGLGKTIAEKIEDGSAIGPSVMLCFLAIGLVVLAIIMICTLFCSIQTIIQCLMNPEYWALKQIFNMI